MKTRNPRRNPQAGDILSYQGWKVIVSSREPQEVRYVPVAPDGSTRSERSKTLDEWTTWAKGAKVFSREGACFQMDVISGPCSACGEQQMSGVHVVNGAIFCKTHCPVAVH